MLEKRCSLKGKLKWDMLPIIFVLAWPTMLEQLLQTAVQYIDTTMVGSLGTQATAAVGSTTTVNWLIGSSVSAVGVGFLAYISQAYGKGDKESAKKASAQSVLAVLILGAFFTALTLSLARFVPIWMQVDPDIQELTAKYFFILYLPMLPRCASIIFGTILRAVGDTKTPMRVGVLVNIINVVLNFFFIYPTREISLRGRVFTIYGTGWGVIGAAIASAVSFLVGGILITVVLLCHKDISPIGYSLRPDLAVLRPCFKVAFPNMLQRFGTSLGYVAFASMINSLGDVSTAAHTIANTVESAFYIPGYGMQTAAATLAGNAVGACDSQRMRDLARMIIFIEVILMIISGGLLFAFAPQMMKLFSKSNEVIFIGSVVLRMVAISEPFYGVSIVMEGMLQGAGKTMMPFIFNIIGMWGIRIIATFICTQIFSFGLVGAWACMIAHNLWLFAMFLLYYLRGKWNPLLRNEVVV